MEGEAYDEMFEEIELEEIPAPASAQMMRKKQDGLDSSTKKVQFDESNLSSRSKKSSKKSSVMEKMTLEQIKEEVTRHRTQGEDALRDKALLRFCQLSNETTQTMVLETDEDHAAASAILKECVSVIEENSTSTKKWPELKYETFNNMARCMNIQGDIQGSFAFLKLAMENVEEFARGQEEGSVTIIPELSLNICNALIYLKKYIQSVEFAERTVTSSRACINSLSKKLKQVDPIDTRSKLEKQRLDQLFLSQINLHIQGFQAKGQAYEKMEAYEEAIGEYEQARRVVGKYFGEEIELFSKLGEKIQSATVNLKTKTYTAASAKSRFSPTKNPIRGVATRSTITNHTMVASTGSALSNGMKKAKTLKIRRVGARPGSAKVKVPKCSKGADLDDVRSFRSSPTSAQKFTTSAQKQPRAVEKTFEIRGAGGSKARTLRPRKASTVQFGRRTESKKTEIFRGNSSSRSRSLSRSFSRTGSALTRSIPAFSASNGVKADCWAGCSTKHQPGVDLYQNQTDFYSTTTGSWKGPDQHVNGRKPKTKIIRKIVRENIVSEKKTKRNTLTRQDHIVSEKIVSDDDDKLIQEELWRLRASLRQNEMKGVDERIKMMHKQQTDSQRSVLMAIEGQREMILESHWKEVQRSRAEREALASKKTSLQQNQIGSGLGCQRCGGRPTGCGCPCQAPQMPPIHPVYGPAVFDYNFHCWTYPYAHWYNPDYQQTEIELEPSEEEVPETADQAVQKDEPPLQTDELYVQTDDTTKRMVSFQCQTEKKVVHDASTYAQEAPRPPVMIKIGLSKDDAARRLQKMGRRSAAFRREREFRKKVEENVILVKHLKYCTATGSQLIMFVHVLTEHESSRCKAIKFSIWDYVSKTVRYQSILGKLKNLPKFDSAILQTLSGPSLRDIGYEAAPYKHHIAVLQSVMKANVHGEAGLRRVHEIAGKTIVWRTPRVSWREAPQAETKTGETQCNFPFRLRWDEYTESLADLLQGYYEEDRLEHEVDQEELRKARETEIEEARKKNRVLYFIVMLQTRIRRFLLARARKNRELYQRENAERNKAKRGGKGPLTHWVRVHAITKTMACHQNTNCKKRSYLVSLYRQDTIGEEGQRLFMDHIRDKITLAVNNEIRPLQDRNGVIHTSIILKSHKKILFELGKVMKNQYRDQLIENLDERPLYKLVAVPYSDDILQLDKSTEVLLEGVRLPEGQNFETAAYFKAALAIESDQSNSKGDHATAVHVPKLLRMKLVDSSKLKNAPHTPGEDGKLCQNVMGCILKTEFTMLPPHRHNPKDTNSYSCRVYKRVRYENESRQRRVHDWKIKITQLEEPKSWDYLVVRRLPCEVKKIQKLLKKELTWTLSHQQTPAPIRYMQWTTHIMDMNDLVTVSSQRAYDLREDRFQLNYHQTYYFQQPLEGISGVCEEHREQDCTEEVCKDGCKQPTKEQRVIGDSDPFYELYVQKLVPKDLKVPSYRYKNKAYLARKAAIIRTTLPFFVDNVEEADSGSEEDDNPEKYKDLQCFWDQEQLEAMQLDEVTVQRRYTKLTCQLTVDQLVQDVIVVEDGTAGVPDPAVEYQYYMEKLRILRSAEDPSKMSSLLQIRGHGDRYKSEDAYKAWLHSKNGGPEKYMSQDVHRWRNQRYAVSVYQVWYSQSKQREFLVEAVQVEVPLQRAYLQRDSLSGVRGKALQSYIDLHFKILSKEEVDNQVQGVRKNDGQSGYGDFEIGDIELSIKPEAFRHSMARNPEYAGWVFEDEKAGEDSAKTSEEEQMEAERAKRLKNNVVRQLRGAKQGSDRQIALAKKVIKTYFAAWRARREYKKRRIGKVLQRINYPCHVGSGSYQQVSVQVQQYQQPVLYKFTIINRENLRQDDVLVIQSFELPGGLAPSSPAERFVEVFKKRLRLTWVAPVRNIGVRKLQDAFFDNREVREEVIHKVVEVVAWGEELEKKKQKYAIKRALSPGSGDSSDDHDLNDEQFTAIRNDIKALKNVLKVMKRKAGDLKGGLREWYDKFDENGTEEIEVNEFGRMIEFLGVKLTPRLAIMLFRLFDRRDIGCFSFSEFSDILDRRMKPNFKRIVKAEQARFAVEGLNIKWPPRPEPEIVWKDAAPIIRRKAVPRPIPKTEEVKQPERIQQPQPMVQPAPIVTVSVEIEEEVFMVQEQFDVIEEQEQFEVIQEQQQFAIEEVTVEVKQEQQTSVQKQPNSWELQDNREREMKELPSLVVGSGQPASVRFSVYSGQLGTKDYFASFWVTLNAKESDLYSKKQLGDDLEEQARVRLIQKRRPNTNPAPATLAQELSNMVYEQLPSIIEKAELQLNQNDSQETWLEFFTDQIHLQFHK